MGQLNQFFKRRINGEKDCFTQFLDLLYNYSIRTVWSCWRYMYIAQWTDKNRIIEMENKLVAARG